MKKILLIGGGGYIGVALSEYFLNHDFKVICYDNFIYENNFAISDLLANPNYELIDGDLRDINKLKTIITDANDIVILGGLVGDPITKKYPYLSDSINTDGIKNLINILDSVEFGKLIFISTCSNYGFIDENIYAKEDHRLEPLSSYAKSKVEIEKHILSKKNTVNYHPTILRFATAFGLSQRMRFDLTINEFTQTIINNKELIIYDADTWRPYCHVKDFSKIIYRIINSANNLTDFQVFNVGTQKNNYTKRDVAKKLLKYFPNAKISFKDKGHDPRNYKVNFDKLKNILGIQPDIDIDYGITEIINYNKDNKVINSKDNKFGNYFINESKFKT